MGTRFYAGLISSYMPRAHPKYGSAFKLIELTAAANDHDRVNIDDDSSSTTSSSFESSNESDCLAPPGNEALGMGRSGSRIDDIPVLKASLTRHRIQAGGGSIISPMLIGKSLEGGPDNE